MSIATLPPDQARPNSGVLAALLRRWSFQRKVHLRQGLLALAQSQPIYEKLTLRLMQRQGLVRRDGVATPEGIALASKTLRDEKRWEIARSAHAHESVAALYDGLTPIEAVLTRDEIAEIDATLGGPKEVV